MPQKIQNNLKTKRSPKKRRSRVQRKNARQDGVLANLSDPSYEEIMTEILQKVGKRPPLPKSLAKGDWTDQALRVLEERYLYRDQNGKITENPEEMCWRVAWEAATAEARWGKNRSEIRDVASKYYELLVGRHFLPNSPTLMNAGTSNTLQYSGCYVLPVDDSLIGIFDAIKYQAIVHQTGGGTGFAFSRLRPQGSMVRSSGGVASGPVSFMRIFDAATNEIKQGGKRRGANMGILRVDHPDILEFIHCKDNGGITNFNISVAVTDKFMEALEMDEKYDLINPRTRQKVKELPATEVFKEIKNSAWKTGDPGIIFIDRINSGSGNPVPSLGPVESTNPCGEQPLYPYDACNLGSIFLGNFVGGTNGTRQVDWERLGEVTNLVVRFLDSIIEVNPFPLEQIRQTVFAIRRIGLGVGGWADMLLEMGIPYDSEEALTLADKVMGFVQKNAVSATEELAKERGPFPLWKKSIYKGSKPRRNSTLTTIAPTGSISIIAGASSGIEPLFAIAYQHKVKDRNLDRTLTFINPKFEEVARQRGFWNEEIRKRVAEHGTIRDIPEIPQDIKNIFGTAHEIHHDWHIKMQAIFQKHTDNAVSKTINMTNSATPDEIEEAYRLAWEMNCKGVTVFRDGCKDAQVLNLGISDDEIKSEEVTEPTMVRPFKVTGATYKLNTPVGGAFVTINEDEKGQPLEVFINVGKAGSDVTAMAEALGRAISTSLRFRGNLAPVERAKEIAYQLSGIGGRRSVGFGPKKILSLPDAIAIALSTHFGFKINGKVGEVEESVVGHAEGFAAAGQEPVQTTQVDGEGRNINGEGNLFSTDEHTKPDGYQVTPSLFGLDEDYQGMEVVDVPAKVAGDICPSCGAGSLVYQEGCTKCFSCGHSEC